MGIYSQIWMYNWPLTLCWGIGIDPEVAVGIIKFKNYSDNDTADAEARRVSAADGNVFIYSIPHKDYFQSNRQQVANHLQSVWVAIGNNKFWIIENFIKSWSSSFLKNRNHEVALERLRIGHTRHTHACMGSWWTEETRRTVIALCRL